MRSENDPGRIDAVILCGGRGERLKRIVKDRPKPMADINGRPFLDMVIDHLSDYGFKRVVLCLGYKADVIRKYYSGRHSKIEILFSAEAFPLGTAGAIKNAEALIGSDPFLVMNGDSYCSINLQRFIDFHIKKKNVLSMALTRSVENEDCGFVRLDRSRKITSFNEKNRTDKDRYVNTGIYLFSKKALKLIPPGKKISLEYEVIPKILNKKIYGFVTDERLTDIGTPGRYRKAKICFK